MAKQASGERQLGMVLMAGSACLGLFSIFAPGLFRGEFAGPFTSALGGASLAGGGVATALMLGGE